MVTREQIELALGEDKDAFRTQDVDHDFIAIKLLRDKIPYDACKNIVRAVGNECIYLAGVDTAIKYLSEEDLGVLADCNAWIDGDMDYIALFI